MKADFKFDLYLHLTKIVVIIFSVTDLYIKAINYSFVVTLKIYLIIILFCSLFI